MLTTVFFIAIMLAAYSRGNYLLGVIHGLVYAMVAACAAAILWGMISQSPVPKLRLSLLILIVIPIALIFAFPTYFNPQLQHFVDKQATARNARAELNKLFGSDPAFSDLGVLTIKLKAVGIEIYGSVPIKSDLDRLRMQILDQCQCVDDCIVHLSIHVCDESQTYTERIDKGAVPASE